MSIRPWMHPLAVAALSFAPIACGSDPPPNDTCAGAIDASGGGSFQGSTCDAWDDLSFPCNRTGTPEVFFAFIDPVGGASWSVERDPTSTLYFSGKDMCGGPGACDPSTLSLTTGVPGTWYLGVEKTGGGCGDFGIIVTRLR